MNDLAILKGIGPKTMTYFDKLNIRNLDDLVNYYPFRYDYLKENSLLEEQVIITGEVVSQPIVYRLRGNLNRMSFKLLYKDQIIDVVIFNRGFLKKHLTLEKKITIIGKYNSLKKILTASDIKLYKLRAEGEILPVYHSTKGLSSNAINNYINAALNIYKDEIDDFLPDYINKKYKFISKLKAIDELHNPTNKKTLDEAIRRGKYEELFLFTLKINYLKRFKNKNGVKKDWKKEDYLGIYQNLKFELTGDQKVVLKEMLVDFRSNKRMNRLLQGDVGSGKTIVAFLALYANYLAGYQTAFMVPTEVLAEQHFKSAMNFFKGLLEIELLTGSTTKNKKQQILNRLEKGEINLIIGTHSLIEEDVKFLNLGLIITDEQHRFGVQQRKSLQNKGVMPDILYLTATPIPRTYALSIYGDLDISTLKDKPNNRREVITYLKKSGELNWVSELMYEQLKKGHQVYVIAPLVEESDKTNLVDINKLAERIKKTFEPKYKVGVLHGKMKSKEKQKVMEAFSGGEIQILISTTVIEVGIDVPNATAIIVFDAHQFGLATLHQLRGRVGRSDLQSHCVLVTDKETERLKIMEQTNDGFLVSEEDFKLRGHGDLFGYKQSGDMSFNLVDLKKDFNLLLEANEDAKEYLDNPKKETVLSKIVKSLEKVD